MRLTLLMGAPGAGKSTYAKQFDHVVSNDDREWAAGNRGHALARCYKRVHGHLAAGEDVVVDATATNRDVRKGMLGIARRYGADVDVRVLDTPLEDCLRAQRERERPVPAADVRRLHDAVQEAIPGLRREGFQNVAIIRR